MQTRLMKAIALMALAYALGVVEYWHFASWHSSHFNDLYHYQENLLHGHAPWLADQNRVLAPLLIEGIRRMFGTDYEQAYQRFMFGSFLAQNLCALILFGQCRLSAPGAAVGLVLAASVPLLLFNYWWFPWTNLETILFLLLFAVDAADLTPKSGLGLSVVIFIASVFTKETAVFMPLWLFLRRASSVTTEDRRWSRLVPIGCMCAAMVIAAIVVDTALRRALWVSGTFPNLPSGVRPFSVGGTYIFLLGDPATVIGEYIQNLWALMTLRIPWPLWNTVHWTGWPMGEVALIICTCMSATGFFWSFRHRDPVLMAITAFSIIYLGVCLLVSNVPEADKLMPVLAAGAYAYAHWARALSHIGRASSIALMRPRRRRPRMVRTE